REAPGDTQRGRGARVVAVRIDEYDRVGGVRLGVVPGHPGLPHVGLQGGEAEHALRVAVDDEPDRGVAEVAHAVEKHEREAVGSRQDACHSKWGCHEKEGRSRYIRSLPLPIVRDWKAGREVSRETSVPASCEAESSSAAAA